MINTIDDIIAAIEPEIANIPHIDDNTRFWMVRSKRGVFFNEYIEEKYIAIGWNALTEDILLSDKIDDYYKQILETNGYPDKVPGTALNKCRRFVEEIREGDIAMIVGKTEIAFALIGKYFESYSEQTSIKKELEVHSQVDGGSYKGGYCPYVKRRQITVISRIDIASATPMVYKCLASNRHSLSSLDDYADVILSCCYDLCFYNNRTIIKYHVCQPSDINPFDFALFTLSVISLLTDDNSQISGKYNLNSEGDIVLFLENARQALDSNIPEHIIAAVLIYFMLFGGSVWGITFPSAIDKIKELVSAFLFRREIRKRELAEIARIEAETAENIARTEKIKVETALLKTSCQDQANRVVDDLVTSSAALKIKPPANNIIDISALLETKNKTK